MQLVDFQKLNLAKGQLIKISVATLQGATLRVAFYDGPYEGNVTLGLSDYIFYKTEAGKIRSLELKEILAITV